MSAQNGRNRSTDPAALPGGLGSPQVLAQLIDSAPDAIVAVGRDGRILLVNAQAEKLFGYPRGDLIGERVEILIPERFRNAHGGHRSHYFSDPHTRPMGAGHELYGRRRDGSEFPAEISLSYIETADGLIASTAIRDASERKRLEEDLRHLAEHDPLTELMNRRRFEIELGRQAALARRYGQGGALLSVDLDGFKAVNDTYGHAAGDELLRRTADVLRARLRETDMAARMGGDEFAVLLPAASPDEAAIVATDLLREVAAVRVELDDGVASTTPSIGIAFLEASDDTPQKLLRRADVAMYDAKAAGGNRFVQSVLGRTTAGQT